MRRKEEAMPGIGNVAGEQMQQQRQYAEACSAGQKSEAERDLDREMTDFMFTVAEATDELERRQREHPELFTKIAKRLPLEEIIERLQRLVPDEH
jgi:hypothetical protein